MDVLGDVDEERPAASGLFLFVAFYHQDKRFAKPFPVEFQTVPQTVSLLLRRSLSCGVCSLRRIDLN